MSTYQVSILGTRSSLETVAARGISLSAAITLARRTAWSIAGQPYIVDVYKETPEGNVMVRTYETEKLSRVGLTRVTAGA